MRHHARVSRLVLHRGLVVIHYLFLFLLTHCHYLRSVVVVIVNQSRNDLLALLLIGLVLILVIPNAFLQIRVEYLSQVSLRCLLHKLVALVIRATATFVRLVKDVHHFVVACMVVQLKMAQQVLRRDLLHDVLAT